jgi:phosphoribosylformylglycinamidine synthase
MDACVDVMDAFHVSFISGKDSLSSTYRGSDGTVIKIPRVLCVSAFGKIPDVTRTISADLKHVGSTLVLLGNLDPAAMGGSAYLETNGGQSAHIPKVQLTKAVCVMRMLQTLIQFGKVHSCHDISEGGLAATLAEMCFGGDMGASIDLQDLGAERADFSFFNEMAGCFLLEVSDERTIAALKESPYATIVGKTLSERSVVLCRGAETFFSVSLHVLKAAWQQLMKEVF